MKTASFNQKLALKWSGPRRITILKGLRNVGIELRHNNKKLLVHDNWLKPYLVPELSTLDPVPDQTLEEHGEAHLPKGNENKQNTTKFTKIYSLEPDTSRFLPERDKVSMQPFPPSTRTTLTGPLQWSNPLPWSPSQGSLTNTQSEAESDAPYKNTCSRPHYHMMPSPTHSHS